MHLIRNGKMVLREARLGISVLYDWSRRFGSDRLRGCNSDIWESEICGVSMIEVLKLIFCIANKYEALTNVDDQLSVRSDTTK